MNQWPRVVLILGVLAGGVALTWGGAATSNIGMASTGAGLTGAVMSWLGRDLLAGSKKKKEE